MALASSSPSLAVAELRLLASCTAHEAASWLDHLELCHRSWPTAKDDLPALELIDRAFTHVNRPEHFTDFEHCEECADHDNTLRSRNRFTIRREDLGTLGWDPISFTNAQGVAYLFPTLARFALLPEAAHGRYGEYATQLVSHLSRDGAQNEFYAWCHASQRAAVFALLEHLLETRVEHFDDDSCLDQLSAALELWKPSPLQGLATKSNKGTQ